MTNSSLEYWFGEIRWQIENHGSRLTDCLRGYRISRMAAQKRNFDTGNYDKKVQELTKNEKSLRFQSLN